MEVASEKKASGDETCIKTYQVIQFVKRGRQKNKSTDVVPATWISFNEKNKKLICFYPTAQYDGLQDAVKAGDMPDKDWPTFNIKIRGQSNSYKRAVKKKGKLETDETAFTSDTDATPEEKSAAIEKAFQRKKLIDDAEAMKSSKKRASSDAYADNLEPVKIRKNHAARVITSNASASASSDRQDNLNLHAMDETFQIEDSATLSFPFPEILHEESLINGSFDNKTKENDESTYTTPTRIYQCPSSSCQQDHDSEKEYRATIMEKLSNIEIEMKVQSTLLRNIWHSQQMTHGMETSGLTMIEKHQISFPITSLDALKEFEKKFKENSAFRKDMMAVIQALLDPEKISRSVFNIFKKFLSRDLAIKHTAVKQMDGKLVFKSAMPTFCSSIIDLLVSSHKVTEARAYSVLGIGFTGAKDWDGHRVARMKNNKEKTTDQLNPNDTN